MIILKNYVFAILVFFEVIPCWANEQSAELRLVRKPYLQSAIADSVSILWRTDAGSGCKIGYRPLGEGEWKYKEGILRKTNTQVIENEVVLTSLKPSAKYEYRIYTDGVHLLASDQLVFSSPQGKHDSIFSFFAVGDIGEPIEESGTPDLLGKTLALSRDSLSFGLLLGDIVYPEGKSEDYDSHFFDHLDDALPYIPVFTVLGNHDWHEPDKNYMQEWKLPGNEHYYSFRQGNIHFIALDTKKGELYNYEDQVKWLRKELSQPINDIDWRVIFLHHNGRSCTYKGDNEAVMSLYPIFEEYGVDLVLNGHAHTYERLNPMNGKGELVRDYPMNSSHFDDPEGFISITVGSGGKLRGIGSDPKPFTPDPENCEHPGLVAAYAHEWAVLYLQVNGRQLNGRVIATDDHEVLDEFMISKQR